MNILDNSVPFHNWTIKEKENQHFKWGYRVTDILSYSDILNWHIVSGREVY